MPTRTKARDWIPIIENMLRKQPLTVRQIAARTDLGTTRVYRLLTESAQFVRTGQRDYEQGGPDFWTTAAGTQ